MAGGLRGARVGRAMVFHKYDFLKEPLVGNSATESLAC